MFRVTQDKETAECHRDWERTQRSASANQPLSKFLQNKVSSTICTNTFQLTEYQTDVVTVAEAVCFPHAWSALPL